MSNGRRLLEGYLNGEALSDEQCADLSRWVCDSLDNARVAAELTHLDQAIRSSLDDLSMATLNTAGWQVQGPDQIDAARALAELARLHDEGLGQDPDLPDFRKALQPQAPAADAALRLPARWLVAGGVAAVLVLGGLVGLWAHIFFNQPVEIAEQPDTDAPLAVASLTDMDSTARWRMNPGSTAPRLGQPLFAGDELVLEAGSAQITTARGAIAILEAPCTVELIDNDNALRLHAGRLVGRVETEQARRFLVRAPHMDITDLGTAFGVDATSKTLTEVHVYEGSVEVSRPSPDATEQPEVLVLNQDQAIRVQADHQAWVEIDPEPTRFASLGHKTTVLRATGAGLALGEIDPHWRVVEVNRRPVETGGEMRTSAWTYKKSTPPPGASLLKIDPLLKPEGTSHIQYLCQTQLNIKDIHLSDASRVVIKVLADHSVDDLVINGVKIKAPNNRIGTTRKYLTMRIDSHLRVGNNTIAVIVKDPVYGGHPSVSGLIASIEHIVAQRPAQRADD